MTLRKRTQGSDLRREGERKRVARSVVELCKSVHRLGLQLADLRGADTSQSVWPTTV